MRYRFSKEGEELQLCVYPGPFAFDHTPDEAKQYYTFPFTEEGYTDAIAFLNRIYENTDWEPVSGPVL